MRLGADVGAGAAAQPASAKNVHFTKSTLLRAKGSGDDGDETCTQKSRASVTEWRAAVIEPGQPHDAKLLSAVPRSGAEPDVGVVAVSAEHFSETASQEQRLQFLEKLALEAKAADSIHLVQLPMDHIHAHQKEAELVGLHGRVVAPGKDWVHGGDGLLILGTKEEAVRNVFGSIKERARAKRRISTETATAAMVGAAAVWGVLAFT